MQSNKDNKAKCLVRLKRSHVRFGSRAPTAPSQRLDLFAVEPIIGGGGQDSHALDLGGQYQYPFSSGAHFSGPGVIALQNSALVRCREM